MMYGWLTLVVCAYTVGWLMGFGAAVQITLESVDFANAG